MSARSLCEHGGSSVTLPEAGAAIQPSLPRARGGVWVRSGRVKIFCGMYGSIVFARWSHTHENGPRRKT